MYIKSLEFPFRLGEEKEKEEGPDLYLPKLFHLRSTTSSTLLYLLSVIFLGPKD